MEDRNRSGRLAICILQENRQFSGYCWHPDDDRSHSALALLACRSSFFSLQLTSLGLGLSLSLGDRGSMDRAGKEWANGAIFCSRTSSCVLTPSAHESVSFDASAAALLIAFRRWHSACAVCSQRFMHGPLILTSPSFSPMRSSR